MSDQSTLSAEERAYFESEGETSFVKVEDDAEAQAKADEAKTGLLETPKDDKPDDEEKGKLVNYGALHQERERRKELETKVKASETELSGLKQFKAAMEEKMRWTDALLTPQEQKTDEPPNPDEDIFAALRYEREKRTALEARLAEREQGEKQARDGAEFEGKVWTFWNQSAAAYKQENPEFEDAVKWMSETRTGQLKALAGLHPAFRTEAGIVQQINKELFDINVAAAQEGVSPAQYIHQMAKEWGYKGKVLDPGKVDLKLPDKLKNVEEAQKANRGVGAASASATSADEISIDTLAAMPQREFNEWMKVPANEKTFARLMGG